MGFEKEQVKASGVWEYKHYLNVGGRTVALYVSRSDGTKFWRYLHQDNQGSTAVVTDHAAALVGNRLSYDAWGKRRNNIGTDATGLTHEVDRGYTGHEHLDNVGLIHMNGRVFDPLLARFVSADPFIKYPENIQNYGRYSYVLNDPLTFTDPDGFKPKKGLLAVASLIMAAITSGATLAATTALEITEVGMYLVSTNAWSVGANMALSGAIGGFTGSLVSSGGDFKSAAFGALSGGMFGFAGSLAGAGGDLTASQFGMHLAAGCVNGALGGGGGDGCARGAASAGFAKLATVGTRGWFDTTTEVGKAQHFAVATIVGGTSSVISGGKFANGAVTAAFGYIFNESGNAPNDRHTYGSRFAREYFEARGYEFLNYEVQASINDLPIRKYDLLMRDPDGALIGIEVKTTILDRFRLNQQQVAFDVKVYQAGAFSSYGTITGVQYFGFTWFGGAEAARWTTVRMQDELRKVGIETRTIDRPVVRLPK